jgi:hypothetical protein
MRNAARRAEVVLHHPHFASTSAQDADSDNASDRLSGCGRNSHAIRLSVRSVTCEHRFPEPEPEPLPVPEHQHPWWRGLPARAKTARIRSSDPTTGRMPAAPWVAAAGAATASAGSVGVRYGHGSRSRPPNAGRSSSRTSHRTLVGLGGPMGHQEDPPLEAVRVSHSVGCCSLLLILPLSLSLKLTLSLTPGFPCSGAVRAVTGIRGRAGARVSDAVKTVHFEWGTPRLASSLRVTWDEERREAGRGGAPPSALRIDQRPGRRQRQRQRQAQRLRQEQPRHSVVS